MLRDLLKDGGLYTLANLLTKGIGLLLIPFYTLYFSTAEYGVRDILMVFGLFVGNIFSLQLNQGLARYVGEPTLDDNSKKLYASTAILSVVFLFTIFAILAFVFSTQLANLLSSNYPIGVRTFRIASGTIVLNNIFYFLNVYLRFLRQSKTVSSLSFAHAITGIILMFFFVFYFDLGVDSIFLPFLFTVPILIIIQLYFLKDQLVLKFRFSVLKPLLKYSIPMLAGALSLVTMNFTDRIFINELLGADSLGIYSLGSQFSSIIGIIITGFGAAMGPIILEKHNRAKTRQELEQFFVLFIGIGTIGALLLSLFSPEIVHLFTSQNFRSAYTVMPMLFFTVLFTGLQMFSIGLIIQMKTKTIALLMLIFAILNLGLNYYFVPKWGIIGAASSTLIATALYQLINFYLSYKAYAYRVNFKKIWPVLVLLTILLYINHVLFIDNPLILVIIKLLIITFYSIFVYKILLKSLIKQLNIFNNK
ncbi:hypothetical protein DNU06_02140 [Putridiphycobacter roseus]|uniref:Uncharacterized protein n=1 Tax=Putridiphycobacter roseus TaxID=2219161 RepID=A0A2W1N678_9FLAO|nr:oligosaccharide flippase family protein [Putridiphycobacter roseus]PZE18651.1 hypothetical protein DNU06_02140 [Putridiphycobacter roseus]